MRARRSWLLSRSLLVLTHVLSAVSVRATAGVVSWLWFVPWQARARGDASGGGRPMPLEVVVDGLPMRGSEVGEGAAVLLVHGWSDHSASMAALESSLAQTGHRVVRFDLPAHGVNPGRRTDVMVMARAIETLVERFDTGTVVAHSLGSLATVLALRDGAPIDRVVLLAPVVRVEHAVASFARMYRLPRRAVRALRSVLEQRFGPDVWQLLSSDRQAPRFEVPALIVHDRGDRQVDVDDARILASAWPGARLLETEGLGHRRVVREPAVIEAVVDFVRRPAERSSVA